MSRHGHTFVTRKHKKKVNTTQTRKKSSHEKKNNHDKVKLSTLL